MILSYNFDGDNWDYEVERAIIIDWLISRFANDFDIDIKKAQELYKFGWLPEKDLEDNYFNEEDLKTYFEQEAYNDYLEARYA